MSEVDQDVEVTPSCRIMISRSHNAIMKYLANPGRVVQHIRKSIDYVK